MPSALMFVHFACVMTFFVRPADVCVSPLLRRFQIDELSKRLENTKKLPTIFNEVGRRLLGVEGANWQRQVRMHTMWGVRCRIVSAVVILEAW